MRVLITGGCGFLGSNLAQEALRRGDAVTVFDDLSRLGSEQNLAWLRTLGPITFVHGDVRLAGDVERVVGEVVPDVLFHLAGQVAMTTSLANPRRDFETNALGSFNVLDAVRRHAPKAAVLYSSTNKVYGDLEDLAYAEKSTRWVATDFPEGFPESLPLDFRTPYGTSKGSADQLMLDHHRCFGLRTTVFRHSSMYGGRQFATYDQGWIGWFCDRAVRQAAGDRTPFTISGDGKQVRDLLHAEDMVRLYFGAAEQIDRVAGRPFNVGGGMGHSLSLLELLALLEELLDVFLVWERLPPRSSDQKVFVANTRALAEAIGWVPQVGAREGLTRMIAWIRER